MKLEAPAQGAQPEAGTPAAPVLSGHDQAMVDKFEGKAPAAVDPKARPENIPEQFWDAEKGSVNTEAAFTSLADSRAEVTRLQQELAELKKGAPPKEPPKEGGKGEPKEAAPKGLDLAALADTYAEKGTFDEAQYAALAQVGISKEYADTYIEGLKAIAERNDAKAKSLIGGEEAWNQMSAWANNAWTKDQHAAFNTAMKGNAAQVEQAMLALSAAYSQANGQAPNLLGGRGGNGDSSAKPFASQAEMSQAMRDPRYHADPAYRAMIEQRVYASPF